MAKLAAEIPGDLKRRLKGVLAVQEKTIQQWIQDKAEAEVSAAEQTTSAVENG